MGGGGKKFYCLNLELENFLFIIIKSNSSLRRIKVIINIMINNLLRFRESWFSKLGGF